MPLTVIKNALTAKFSQDVINQIRNGVDDNFIIDFAEDTLLTDMLYWSNEWDWECDTTINSGYATDGIKWTFKSEKELGEFLLLFSLKWGNQTYVNFA